jgi:hypothetical protein
MARYTKNLTVKVPMQWYYELKDSADAEGRPAGQMLRVILLGFNGYGKKMTVRPTKSSSQIEYKRVNIQLDEYTMCEIEKIATKVHRPKKDVVLQIMVNYLDLGDNLHDYYI